MAVSTLAVVGAGVGRTGIHLLKVAPAAQLLEWQPGEGWGPICERLGVATPDEPFPVTNTTEDFRSMFGMPPLADHAEDAST